MKIKHLKYIILSIWIIVVIYIYLNDMIPSDLDELKDIINGQRIKSVFMFLFISVARIIFFIPSVVFIILGGLCFGHYTGFILSMLSLIISQSIVYVGGKYFSGDRIYKNIYTKHKKLIEITDEHGYKFLGLGILCPVLPSDVICVIAAILNFKYKRYIITIIFANIPAVMIYSFLGGNATSTAYINNIIAAILLIAIFAYTIIIWLRIKKSYINSNDSK